MNKYRLLLGVSVLVLTIMLWAGVLQHYVTVDMVKQQGASLHTFVLQYKVLSAIAYNALYAALVFIGIPVTAPLSVLGGYLFGAYTATLYGVGALIFGSLLYIYLVRRYGEQWLKQYDSHGVQTFKNNINAYGYSYIIALHFLLIIPLVMINTFVALSAVPWWVIIATYAVASTPIVFIYALAGRHLQTMDSFSDILSPTMVLILLGIASCMLLPTLIKMIRTKSNPKRNTKL